MIDAIKTSSAPSMEAGHIGRIPVRNLWLLMLYASDLYRHLDAGERSVEENPDDIPDLVARILTKLVERRLKRNLSFGYQFRESVINRVRGRVNLIETERRQLLDRGMIACRYEELTVDTPRNRYVRAALGKLAKVVHCSDLAHRCRSLAESLRRIGVSGVKPEKTEVSIDRFGRHDIHDKQMVTAAHLAFELALPSEEEGTRHLPLPEREVTWVRHLYEKAVAGFYRIALSGHGWRIYSGKAINWLIEDKSSGIDRILPGMVTDIMLDHAGTGRRIIIDTKFTSIITKGWHREETLRSGYLYQIYAYLRSQEGNGDPFSDSAAGLLLHPSIDDMVDEHVVIQGHSIRFATVDLGTNASEIRRQLLNVVGLSDEYPL